MVTPLTKCQRRPLNVAVLHLGGTLMLWQSRNPAAAYCRTINAIRVRVHTPNNPRDQRSSHTMLAALAMRECISGALKSAEPYTRQRLRRGRGVVFVHDLDALYS